MRLVHIISSLEVGGAQAVLFNVVTNLPGYDHTILYFHDGPYRERFAQRGIPIYHGGDLSPVLLVRLITQLRALKPDLIHTSLWAANWFGRIAGWWCGIPVVMALHNKAGLNGAIRPRFDFWAPRATGVIAVSDEVRKSFGSLYKAPVHVITNGVWLDRMPAPRTRSSLGLHDDHFVIGAVGRFAAVKRFDLLIAAYAMAATHISHARLILMGQGPEENALHRLVTDGGLAEKVLFIKNEDARSFYPLFDCFVQPSAQEGVSIALLEAMGAGIACLVTHDEGNHHPVIAAEYDGIVCAGSAADLSAAIVRLGGDTEQRRLLGARARETVVQRFHAKSTVESYDRLFKHIHKGGNLI